MPNGHKLGAMDLRHLRTFLTVAEQGTVSKASLRLRIAEPAQRVRRAYTGILKVATTPQTMEGVFSAFLHRYAERRPNVQVRLIEAVGPSLLDKLERGDVHL